MLRLDLVYCISFSICHHVGLRLILWRFLLVKAFKRSGCVSCTAYRPCSKSEMTLCILLFHGCTDKACILAGLEAPNWPREDISPAMHFDNYRSSDLVPSPRGSQRDSDRESQEVGLHGGGPCVVQTGGWRERVLSFLWSLSNILWWQGPFLKLQILNHIWSKVVDVCLYLSCLAPRIKFPSNTSGNCS